MSCLTSIPKTKEIISKVITLGDTCVGKTSIIRQYVQGSFDANSRTTIGVDFFSRTVGFCGDCITFRIWDTAGQENHRSLMPYYFRDAHACILAYSIDSRQSFLNLAYWFDAIKKENDKASIILVANKVDLPGDERRISTEEGREKALALGGIPFFEVSAKEGINLEEVFDKISELIWFKYGLSEEQTETGGLRRRHQQQQQTRTVKINFSESPLDKRKDNDKCGTC